MVMQAATSGLLTLVLAYGWLIKQRQVQTRADSKCRKSVTFHANVKTESSSPLRSLKCLRLKDVDKLDLSFSRPDLVPKAKKHQLIVRLCRAREDDHLTKEPANRRIRGTPCVSC